MHVGSNGKRSKTEAIYCPARTATYGDGDTSDLVLNCGGTVSFTESYVYLGSLLYYDQCLTDHHDVEARITRVLRVRSVSREDTLLKALGGNAVDECLAHGDAAHLADPLVVSVAQPPHSNSN